MPDAFAEAQEAGERFPGGPEQAHSFGNWRAGQRTGQRRKDSATGAAPRAWGGTYPQPALMPTCVELYAQIWDEAGPSGGSLLF